MDDAPTPEVVTEDEAIDKVKRWIEEMDWEKAKEGALEILEIDPNNEEVKAFLAQAEKGLAERPTEAVKPAEMVADKAAEVAPKAEPQPAAAPAPAPQQPAQSTTQAPAPAAQPAPAAAPAPLPQRKSKSTVIIAGVAGFLILVLLILALVFGWLNPVFDWIFGLIG